LQIALIHKKRHDKPNYLISLVTLLALVRSIYRWGLRTGRVTSDPTPGIGNYRKEEERTRWLTDAEIATFWAKLPEAAMSNAMAIALKVELVTGQRSGEVLGMKRSELDLTHAMWVLPASRIEDKERRTKNRDEHRVPLSPLAISLINEAMALAPSGEWLFPNPTRTGPMEAHAASVAMLRSKKTLGIDNLRAHDLRRTCATGMGNLGITDATIDMVQNHRTGGVGRKHYNHAKYDREKRQALEAWGAHVEEVVGLREPASNVVPMVAR
jgi:integrase